MIVADHSVCMLIDSNVRDHMLQQFKFLTRVQAVMAAAPLVPYPRTDRA